MYLTSIAGRSFLMALAAQGCLLSWAVGAESPKVFRVAPGLDTLAPARDAIRAWRAAGHTNEAATVWLAPGAYGLSESLFLDKRDGNVTWESAKDGKAVIQGGRRLANLVADSAGVWRTRCGMRFEQLYVNGHRATRARLPLHGFFAVAGADQKLLADGRAELTVKLPAPEMAMVPDMTSAPGLQLLVFHKWDTSRYPVKTLDAAGRTITVESEPMKPWNPWNAQSRLILDNCGTGGALVAGRWFLDPQNVLHYRPRAGEKLGRVEMIAPALDRLVCIDGADNLSFDGVWFGYTGYELPRGGCPPAQAASMIGAAVEADGARDLAFHDCRFYHTGNYALWLRQGCRNGRIDHCLLDDLGAGGIRLGEMVIRTNAQAWTGGMVVDNNIICGCGRVHPSAVGIWIGQSANDRVTHNDISDTDYTGVSVGWSWGYGRSLATNNFIGFNRIHEIGRGVLSDMGGVYMLGVSHGSACVGNVIFNVRAHDYGGWGIYPDEGSTGWRIESNLVWHCTCVNRSSGGAFHQHYGATNLIANNIFAFSSGPPLQATRAEDHLSFVLERNVIVSSRTVFFVGPWNKLHFQSWSNCYVSDVPPDVLFPTGDLASWQEAGHEAGSLVTNIVFKGKWPDVMVSPRSPASLVGFEPFDPGVAGVYGDRKWKQLARANPEAVEDLP